MKTWYICEFCGKSFGNSDACRHHEQLCGITEDQKDFVAYDDDRKPMTFNDFVHGGLEQVCYLHIVNKKSFDFVNKCFHDWGNAEIAETQFVPDSHYYYDWSAERWLCLEKRIDFLNKMLEEFSENNNCKE